MKCPFCGVEIDDGSFFCTSCGNKLIESPADKDENDNLPEADNLTDLTICFDEISNTETTATDDENGDALMEDVSDESDEEADEEAFDESDENQPENSEATEEEANEDQESGQPEDEEISDELAVQEEQALTSDANGRLSLAVILLSAALLAMIGFLLLDKVLSLTPADSRATTIQIVSQSEDVKIKAGTLTEFFVDARGTNLTYQWYVKKSGEQMWHVWKNHDMPKTASKANETWDGMQVYCMIVDNNRTSLASDIITITIEK